MKKIYLIALLSAVLTGIAVFNYAKYLQNSVQKDNGFVVVALKRIPENTLITEEMVELKKLPKEAINPLSLNNVALAKRKITNAAIEAGEQILTSRLNEKGGNSSGGLAFMIPDGKRAITIEVSDITGVAGFIKKTNHVDVIATQMMDSTANGKTEKASKSVLLLQDKEVLETNSSSSSKNSSGYTNITLAVTPEEAVKLFYAQTNGKLTVALRPVLDTTVNNAAPYAP